MPFFLWSVSNFFLGIPRIKKKLQIFGWIFFSSGHQDIQNFLFFFFLQFELIFHLLKFLLYLLPFKSYNKKRFRFFNSAPPQCTAFFVKKQLFGTYTGLKGVV